MAQSGQERQDAAVLRAFEQTLSQVAQQHSLIQQLTQLVGRQSQEIRELKSHVEEQSQMLRRLQDAQMQQNEWLNRERRLLCNAPMPAPRAAAVAGSYHTVRFRRTHPSHPSRRR